MTAAGPRPRRVPPPEYVPRPYVFTLERRENPTSPYQPWAVVAIELGATHAAVRAKGPDGAPHPTDRHPLPRGGAERFFSEDLPQLGRVGAEVTRNTPSVHFVLAEIQKHFRMQGVAIFRGRVRVVVIGAMSPDDSVQRAADVEYQSRAADMPALP